VATPDRIELQAAFFATELDRVEFNGTTSLGPKRRC
jgi:hypothetical protein